MDKVIIFLGQNININNYDLSNSYIVGVDSGAYILASNNIHMNLAIGDFDSIDNKKDIIEKYSNKIIKLNPIKDVTDTFAAIEETYKLSNDITILGGIQGKRIEHFIANILLFKKYDNIKFIDDNSYIFKTNTNIKIKKDKYKFISLFPLEDSIISLNGFKYNLNEYNMNLFDYLGVSNEIIDEYGEIKIIKGSILIIKSIAD